MLKLVCTCYSDRLAEDIGYSCTLDKCLLPVYVYMELLYVAYVPAKRKKLERQKGIPTSTVIPTEAVTHMYMRIRLAYGTRKISEPSNEI